MTGDEDEGGEGDVEGLIADGSELEDGE